MLILVLLITAAVCALTNARKLHFWGSKNKFDCPNKTQKLLKLQKHQKTAHSNATVALRAWVTIGEHRLRVRRDKFVWLVKKRNNVR